MTKSMQREFKALAKVRDFWRKENAATHQDLAGLFVARAVERYLKAGGRLAFVVPNSVIDRDYWGGFRRGTFDGAGVMFGVPWDLRRVRPHLFPRGSAVIFGERSAEPRVMPPRAVIWKGKAPARTLASEHAAALTQELGDLHIGSVEDELSPYHSRFAQGATLVPRLLSRVQRITGGALGVPSGFTAVASARSATEKKPWKELEGLSGTVESQFLFSTYLGEHVLPFRTLTPDEFVLPLTGKGQVLAGTDQRIDAYPALATWVRKSEALWNEHGAGNLEFIERLDYMRGLSQQVPATALRVVYAKAGMHMAAALIDDPRAIIDHKLYWGAVTTRSEGNYLVGILNSPSLTELVRPLMSYGKDERDIDKAVWRLPIPMFDADNDLHRDIASVAQKLSDLINERAWNTTNFVTMRRDVRATVATGDLGKRLDALVREVLGEPPLDGSAELEVQEAGLLRVTAGTLGLDRADVEVDLDIEFDQARHVYLWGILITEEGAGGPRYTSIGSAAPDVDSDGLARSLLEVLSEILETAAADERVVRVYHYGDTERVYLERLLGPEAVGILSRATDLLRVIRSHFFAGSGYGLKQLAPQAGFSWRDDVTGSDTYDLIAQARAGDQKAWQTLLRYNEDDTRATHALREWLRNGAGV